MKPYDPRPQPTPRPAGEIAEKPVAPEVVAAGNARRAAARAPRPAAKVEGFPTSLAEVPAEQRLAEKFGVGWGALSVGAMAVAAAFGRRLIQGGIEWNDQAKWLAGAIGVALVAGAIEVVRRLRATTLVVHGERIALYRGGEIGQVISPMEIGEYRLNLINTLRELFLFGILSLIGTCGSVLFVPHSTPGPRPDSSVDGFAFALGLAVTGIGGLVSSIVVRTLCRHYIIPRGNGSEYVALPKSKLHLFRWF